VRRHSVYLFGNGFESISFKILTHSKSTLNLFILYLYRQCKSPTQHTTNRDEILPYRIRIGGRHRRRSQRPLGRTWILQTRPVFAPGSQVRSPRTRRKASHHAPGIVKHFGHRTVHGTYVWIGSTLPFVHKLIVGKFSPDIFSRLIR
jgi:hypothetical protein